MPRYKIALHIRKREIETMNRLLNWLQTLPISGRLRKAILRRGGVAVGESVTIFGGSFFGSEKCAIGDGSFISVGCFIDGSEWVHIGKNAAIGAGVQLVTASHAVGPPTSRAGAPINKPVFIGDGCWLGASCIILPGVAVASGCIIAAGAVVSKSTEENGLYAGVPARRIRNL